MKVCTLYHSLHTKNMLYLFSVFEYVCVVVLCVKAEEKIKQ